MGSVTTDYDKVVRGGSFILNLRDFLRSSIRFHYSPDYRYFNIGFRCARSSPYLSPYVSQLYSEGLAIPQGAPNKPAYVKCETAAVALAGIVAVNYPRTDSVFVYRKGGQVQPIWFGSEPEAKARASAFAKRIIEALPE